MADAFTELENNTNLSQTSKNIDNKGDPQGEYPKPEYQFNHLLDMKMSS